MEIYTDTIIRNIKEEIYLLESQKQGVVCTEKDTMGIIKIKITDLRFQENGVNTSLSSIELSYKIWTECVASYLRTLRNKHKKGGWGKTPEFKVPLSQL